MITLSPQGRAIAAIALAFSLLTGSLHRVAYALIGIFGDSFPDGRGGVILFSAFLGGVGLLVLLLAVPAARAEGWAGAVGQGAVVLTWVGLATIAINLVGGLLHGEESFAIGLYPGLFGFGSEF